MKSATIEQKKLQAWLMYKEGCYTQEYICDFLTIARKTFTAWKQKNKWEDKRKALLVTKEAQLISFYNQLDKLNTRITDRDGVPDSKEGDLQVKLTASIKNLEIETSLGEVSEVGKLFLRYTSDNAADKIKIVADLFHSFMLDYQKRVG